jgi:hypothetical protein
LLGCCHLPRPRLASRSPLSSPQVAELRRRETADERVMYAIAAENKRMSEPMRAALEEVREAPVALEERDRSRRGVRRRTSSVTACTTISTKRRPLHGLRLPSLLSHAG